MYYECSFSVSEKGARSDASSFNVLQITLNKLELRPCTYIFSSKRWHTVESNCPVESVLSFGTISRIPPPRFCIFCNTFGFLKRTWICFE
jgi:hypothetical protein